MTRRSLLRTLPACGLPLAAAVPTPQPWGDTSRLGRPFSKDPSVLRMGGRYLLYFSVPGQGSDNKGWGIGIAESGDLVHWSKVAEVTPGAEYEAKGICSPFVKRIGNRVHLFYQTYGGGAADSICHATSADGIHFERNKTNPIFRCEGAWNCGRAIDAEVIRFQNRWFLYAATRDPAFQVQMLAAAVSDKGFDRGDWRMAADHAILKPELPWEKKCIEAPALIVRNNTLFLFYGGAYNNAPQQIGCARSQDGVRFERLSNEPFLAVGAQGSWNSSESGHPAVFEDEDGQTYLFYQGNNDNGRTWSLSFERIGWKSGLPYVLRA